VSFSYSSIQLKTEIQSMKIISKVFVLFIILFASYDAGAQVISSSRPNLFNNFSTNIPTAVAELDKAFLAAEGSSIQSFQCNNQAAIIAQRITFYFKKN
jgi:hypothetical protein